MIPSRVSDYIFPMTDPSQSMGSAKSALEAFAAQENQELKTAIDLLSQEVGKVDDPVGVYVTLFDFYSELELMEEAGEALVNAAALITEDAHPDLAYFLYNQLELFAQLSPGAEQAYERLSHMIAEDSGAFDPNTVHLDQRKLNMTDLIPEILLAQHMVRNRALSDAEYRLLIQDLCWCDAKEQTDPRTCLYVLHHRELPHEGRAIEFLAHDSAIPFVDLKLVEPDPDLLEILPREHCIRRAAVVFGEVGGEPMVALLNPFNLQLREDIGRQLDCDPHFYLTNAEGYNHFLEVQRGED